MAPKIHACPGLGTQGCGTIIRIDQELCGFCLRERGPRPMPTYTLELIENDAPTKGEGNAMKATATTAVTRTFTCQRCGSDFDHTYPNGHGKACRFCADCKGGKGAGKSTAMVPRAPAPRSPAVRRPATTATVVAPMVPADAAAMLIADLVRERGELDIVVGYLGRRFGIAT